MLINTGEAWDDGNTANSDGWSSTWQVETNWSCAGAPSVWYEWGNGVVNPGEACDDNNNINGDGCSSTWTIEAGWVCSGTLSIWSYCGDGIIQYKFFTSLF